MTKIDAEKAHFTMVNIFTTQPEHQQKLFEVMSKGADVMGAHEGCVAVQMHLSNDGTKLITITEWLDQERFDSMRARSDLQSYFREVGGLISSVDPNPCQLTYAHNVA